MSFQTVLVYLTLFLALGYLVNRFVLPPNLKIGKKNQKPGCGEDDCGCH